MTPEIDTILTFLNQYVAPVLGSDVAFEYAGHSFVEGKFYVIRFAPIIAGGKTFSQITISKSLVKDCEYAYEYGGWNPEETDSLTQLFLKSLQ